jgi:DNA repair protein RecO (recombination protein O)
MDWSDEGIVLSTRPHGENGLIASLLTRDHGRHAGFVPGGVSRRARPTWQPGNLVKVEWRARLSEQLGNFSGELREPYAAAALDNAAELAGLAAACALVDAALAEREPHPAMFDGFRAFLG